MLTVRGAVEGMDVVDKIDRARRTVRARTGRLAVGVGLVVGLAACGGGPDFETFPPATTVAKPPTTAPAPAVTEPAAIEIAEPAPAESAAPTTAAPATDPPVPTTSLEQSIREGFAATQAAFIACSEKPAGCDVRAQVLEGSSAFRPFQDVFVEQAASGLVVRVVPEFNYYVVESIAVKPSRNAATLTACIVDGNWLMQNAGTPDDPADDILVDDDLASYRMDFELASTPDGWRITGTTLLERWEVENQCGPQQ
jgi:hypothetical protein